MTDSRADVASGRRRELVGAGVLLVGIVVFIVEPLGGPVLLSLSGSHGLDLGDLVALPFLAAGALCCVGGPTHERLLGLAARLAGDVPTAAAWATIMTGAAFVLVQVVGESSLPDRAGLLPLALALATLAVLLVLLADPEASDAVFGAPAPVLGLALLTGFAVDITDAAAGSIMGPTVLAAVLLVSLGRRTAAARWTMAVLLVLFVVSDLASLYDVATLETEREAAGGGVMRVGALGVLMVAAGVLALARRRTRSGRPVG